MAPQEDSRSTNRRNRRATAVVRRTTRREALLARITELQYRLQEIKTEDLDVRIHLFNAFGKPGTYCLECSPNNLSPGTCGHTCALVSPLKEPSFSYVEEHWGKRFKEDMDLWTSVVKEMDDRGTAVYAATVGRWERMVKVLQAHGQNNADMHPCAGPLNRPARIDGWRERWNFEDAWGRGPSQASGHEVTSRDEEMAFAEGHTNEINTNDDDGEDAGYLAEEKERIEDDDIGPMNENKYEMN